MKFPLVVEADLDDRRINRYHRHIDSDESGWHRRFTESIWRRHQHPSNAALSGWRRETDRKKRLIHFYDEYGLEGRDFVLRNMYLHLGSIACGDIDGYTRRDRARLARGRRRLSAANRAPGQRDRRGRRDRTWRRGDLSAVMRQSRSIRGMGSRPAAARGLSSAGRRRSKRGLPAARAGSGGLRGVPPGRPAPKLAREEPRLVPAAELRRPPAQVELGCGPSIEAGIPHLSTLHRIYGVSRADYSFVFRAGDDPLLSCSATRRPSSER